MVDWTRSWMSRANGCSRPRFFLMCGFSFAVFLSAFQLFPTAPFHIRDLGGSTFAAGLFLACLTFASAVVGAVHRRAWRTGSACAGRSGWAASR